MMQTTDAATPGLPGPGTIYVGQQLRFVRPVGLGDVITVSVTVKEKRDKNMVLLDCLCTNRHAGPRRPARRADARPYRH